MLETVHLTKVYVHSFACAIGPLEAQGPLGQDCDCQYDDIYCEQKTYEEAERKLVSDACELALSKGKLQEKDLDLLIGGDLINQLGTSNYFVRDIAVPFIGVYGACSNSTLSALQSAQWIESGMANTVMSFTSSHNATAERQFRFPNEYGIQKPETTTFTVTGAGSIILSNHVSEITMSAFTVGRVIDWDFTNANDMGNAMVPAAFDTITRHFKETKTSFEDYDFIATGDLSTYGLAFLTDLLIQEGYDPKGKLVDCGCIIYDRDNQPVFAGGSGCACSSVVTIAYFFKRLLLKEIKKIMIVATGALLAPIMIQQKESIPCVAHAVVYQRVE